MKARQIALLAGVALRATRASAVFLSVVRSLGIGNRAKLTTRRIVVALLQLLALSPLAAFAAPNGVVISGFQVRGPAGGSDEYVELLNTSASTVTIGGWKLLGCASGTPGTTSVRATITSGVTLAAGKYYLFTNNASGGYSGTVTGDATYATGFTDFSSSNYSGIQLVNGSNVVQDGVGSPLSPCREGTGFSTPTSSSTSDAYARAGNGTTDTGNNVTDFVGPQLSNPHNNSGAGGQACTNDGLHIYTIQGLSHTSPYSGKCVINVPGIITAVGATGFYMQDPDGDGNPATSDGVFVFTSTAPPFNVGAQVKVNATVQEYSAGSNNTTTTELTTATVVSASGLFTNTTVTPTIIGTGGRIPPSQVIDNDTNGSVLVASQTTYDPDQDGIDFYESLEGMLVQVNNARVTGSTNKFGEIWLVGDMGVNATSVNSEGGLTLVPYDGVGVDYNPERIMVDTSGLTTNYPQTNVGDTTTQVVGVMGYDFANYRIYPLTLPTFTSGGLTPSATTLSSGSDRLTISTYNISNFNVIETDICDGAVDQAIGSGRMAKIVSHITSNLGSPAILSLEEVQDNDGCTDDGVVAADVTLNTLIQAIVAAGGPNYQWVSINPVNDQDGGLVGGNIRQAILYDTSRVTYVPGTVGVGGSTSATAIGYVDGQLVLTLSPGRINPTSSAFSSSRKPLAATFDVNGHRLVVVSNHFNSKGGDQPLFGKFQPPAVSSATQRAQQTQIVHDFVAQALSLDPKARIVVLGDLNDFAFSTPLLTLDGQSVGNQILYNVGESVLAPVERFGYVYDGNSQELDHIYVSSELLPNAQFQAMHVNAEYFDGASDHDPLLASLAMAPNQAPVANAGTGGEVTAGSAVTLDGTASTDADGTIVSYLWTQTAGPAVTLDGATAATASFTAPATAATLSFTLTVTDDEGATSTATVNYTVTVPNQPPVANAGADQTVPTLSVVSLSGAASTDADGSIASYAWTQTGGTAVTLSGTSSATPTFTAPTTAGTLSFTLTVTDDKGATATASVNVIVTNQAPTADAGADQNVTTLAIVTLSGAASSDVDGSIASYAWTQTAGTPVTLSSTSTATPTFTAPTAGGTLSFTLTVTDDAGATATDSVSIVVLNQPPVASAGPDESVATLAVVTLNGTESSDADGSIASYAWVQTAGTPVSLNYPSSATPNFTAPTTAGELSFTLTVTDNAGMTATDSVVIDVTNQGPTANAGADQSVNTLSTVTLNGSASADVDGSIASYSWTQTAGTPVVLSNASSATPSFTAPTTAGTLVFELTVTDNAGATASAAVTVTVLNQAPTASAGSNQTVAEQTPVTLNGTASSDVDGSIASYSWVQTGGTPVTLSSPTSATPSFTAPSVAGTLSFTLTVTDNAGATASASVQVSVYLLNKAPAANAGVDQNVVALSTVGLNGTASSDVDGMIVSYAWVQTGGTPVILSSATSATPTFTAPAVAGTLSFTLTVTDNSGATASDSVNVVVTVPNQAPVANAGADQSAAPRAKVTLNGTGSYDADGSIVSYSWVQTSGTSAKLKCTTSATPYFTVPGKAAGVLTFKLTVTDNGGATATDSVSVTVTGTALTGMSDADLLVDPAARGC